MLRSRGHAKGPDMITANIFDFVIKLSYEQRGKQMGAHEFLFNINSSFKTPFF